ncbi:hypothetical protein NKDENANG_02332 [Candidatus Entotheonellaceae bacterium PAL068K]
MASCGAEELLSRSLPALQRQLQHPVVQHAIGRNHPLTQGSRLIKAGRLPAWIGHPAAGFSNQQRPGTDILFVPSAQTEGHIPLALRHLCQFIGHTPERLYRQDILETFKFPASGFAPAGQHDRLVQLPCGTDANRFTITKRPYDHGRRVPPPSALDCKSPQRQPVAALPTPRPRQTRQSLG